MTQAAAREAKRKKDDLFFKYNMSSSIGCRQVQLGKHKDAIIHFTKAMESALEDKVLPLVIARSKALSKSTQYKEARADAQLAIQTQPDNILALENDAFTLHKQDDFEDALVRYYRGLALRRKPDYFYNGVKVGDETIQICIGRKSGPMLDQKHLGKTVIDIEFKDYSEHLEEAEFAKKRKESERKDHYFSEKYLRRLALDKTFYLYCLKNPDLHSGNKSHNEQLNTILNDTLNIINRQQETLMTRCPVYVLKHEEPKMSIKMQEIKEKESAASRNGAMKVIERFVNEAEQAKLNQDIQKCLHFTDRTLRFIASQPKRLLDDKLRNKLNATVYEIIGQLYLDMKALIPDLTWNQNEQRIKYMLGMSIKDKFNLETIKKTVTPDILNLKNHQRNIESLLETSGEALERTYLQHELAWSLSLLGQHEIARKAAVAGYRTAKQLNNQNWCINNAFLVARADINQTYVDEAKLALNEAINRAKRMGNDSCVTFLEKIVELAENPEMLDLEGPSMEEKRINEIIELMPTPEMRMEASTLLQKMTHLPQHKRMPLIHSSVMSKRMSDRGSRKTLKIHARAKRQTLMESNSNTKYRSVILKMKSVTEENKY